MKCMIDLEQWMLDMICEKLEGQIRYYKESQSDDRLTPELRRQFVAYIPTVEAKLAYYKSFQAEIPDVCA